MSSKEQKKIINKNKISGSQKHVPAISGPLNTLGFVTIEIFCCFSLLNYIAVKMKKN